MDITDKLFDLIEKRGLSHYRFANDVGFSGALVSKWYKRKASPSFNSLVRIAEYFEVPISYFTDGAPPENPPAQKAWVAVSEKQKKREALHLLVDTIPDDKVEVFKALLEVAIKAVE